MNIKNHPCFNDKIRHKFGRIHLPVAAECNIQCKFCNRRHDCVNESRPGVTSAVLTPKQALEYLKLVMDKRDDISVVGIAGPGDPFANPKETLKTLKLTREHYPEMLLCVATNGLNIAPYIDELAEIDVSHVTITINAVAPKIGKDIYSWVRYNKVVYKKEDAAKVLLKNQINAIKKLKEKGITVKINSIIIPGINDSHIRDAAEKMQELRADIMNCVPIYPVKDTEFEFIETPNNELIKNIRKEASKYMPQMEHCERCRADAVGLLSEGTAEEFMELLKYSENLSLNQKDRPYVAVASMEGMLVNQHLGEAKELLIYAKKDNGFELIDIRKTPKQGGGMKRWQELAEILKGCKALVVSGIGSNPLQVLKESGISVVEVEGIIEEALTSVYEGKSIRGMKKRSQFACGQSCNGTGEGCG